VEEVEVIACREAVRFTLQLGLADVVLKGTLNLSQMLSTRALLATALLVIFWMMLKLWL